MSVSQNAPVPAPARGEWLRAGDTAGCSQIACLWEAAARKVGNVHPGAAFADLEFMHFALSAMLVGKTLERTARTAGELIEEGVELTRSTIGTNSNLGILLLLAPLALASPHRDLRSALPLQLSVFTIADTQRVYRAIRMANPGGLGEAPRQDVRDEPTVPLLEAMQLAADRDLIARQYANGYADIFDLGVPSLLEGWRKFGSIEAAIVHSQFRWLEVHPDSLIARKNGLAKAEEVQARAAEVMRSGGIATTEGRRAGIALDASLRSDGNKLNPGAIADLIAASLFVALREGQIQPSDPFRWITNEWL